MKFINIILFFCLASMLQGCSIFNKKPEINASIRNNELIFSVSDNDIIIIAYEINSLEEFKEDGLTYKNILRYENYDGFKKIIIDDYKNKKIINDHAYYLLITKEGVQFQTLGFCIKNNLIHIQKKSINDKDFVKECKKN